MCVYINICSIYVCQNPYLRKNNTSRTPCLPSIRNRGVKAWITIYIYIYSVCIYIILYLLFYIILYWFYHWLLFFDYFPHWCLNHHGSLAPLEPQDDWWKICGREMPLLSRFLDRVQKMLGEKYLHFLFGQAGGAWVWGPKTTSFIGCVHCCTSIEVLEIHGRIMESDLNPYDAAWVLWMRQKS